MFEVKYLKPESQLRLLRKQNKITIKEAETLLLGRDCKLGQKIVTNNTLKLLKAG